VIAINSRKGVINTIYLYLTTKENKRAEHDSIPAVINMRIWNNKTYTIGVE